MPTDRQQGSYLALLEACVTRTDVGVVIADQSGNIVSINDNFLRLWQIAEDRTPHDWHTLVDLLVRRAADGDALRERLEEPTDTSLPQAYMASLRDGSIREGHLTPAVDGEGHALGWMMSCRDTTQEAQASTDLRAANDRLLELGRLKSQLLANAVTANTERLAAQEQLRQANDRLEELLLFKSQLLGNMSHELGTPLTPIRLQLHLISSERLGALTSKQRKAVGIIERNLDRMTNLVRDVLEVARLDAGRLRLERENMGMEEAVIDVVESLDLQARQTGVELHTAIEGDLPVYADRNRVSQILFNLLTNAIKYSPAGSVVDVSGRRRGDRVVVQIADHGAGMSEDQLKRLFRPFSQVQEGTRQKQGTGLGLYIARGFAEEHGGSLKGTSPGRDKGSTFTLELPLAKPGEELGDRDEVAGRRARPPLDVAPPPKPSP